MANIPSNLSYGTVKGRFIVGYKDSADSGSEPDAIPASGSIFFTAAPTSIKNAEASPVPVTIFPAVAEATLDSEGYLCGYGTTRGIILIATDDPSGNPVDWTWRADFRLTDSVGTPLAFQPFSFELPSGEEVDLTLVAPVSESGGQSFLIGPQGIQGIQGIQGEPGQLENLTVVSPLEYEVSTSTLTFDDADYIYTAGNGLTLATNEFEIDETIVATLDSSPTFTGTVAAASFDGTATNASAVVHYKSTVGGDYSATTPTNKIFTGQTQPTSGMTVGDIWMW
jgi:hypothetical protein